jgi:glutathione peroxidase
MNSVKMRLLRGGELSGEQLRGHVVLVVNVASQCAHTPQYGALEWVQRRFRERGLVVLGVPCNQFGGQEPGSPEQISVFCSDTYGVSFPLLDKQDVNGPARSSLYHRLVHSAAGCGRDVRWNFEKFLVDRDGRVVGRFAPDVDPESRELIVALERALDAK